MKKVKALRPQFIKPVVTCWPFVQFVIPLLASMLFVGCVAGIFIFFEA